LTLTPESGNQPTFLGEPHGTLASWLGIEDDITDSEGALLPPVVEGRLERAQRRAQQGRAVQMEVELREAVLAARVARIRIPSVRLRAIEIPCYTRAAKECQKRAKKHARRGDVNGTQTALLSARHYAALADIEIDEKGARRILRKANLRAFVTHAKEAKRQAAIGNLAMTRMSAALAKACYAAAVENGAKRRRFDDLEGIKLRARLNAVRNGQRFARATG
ncbi:MAG: hypothetical protein AAF658_08685, partial [Myxococcota bacterium]